MFFSVFCKNLLFLKCSVKLHRKCQMNRYLLYLQLVFSTQFFSQLAFGVVTPAQVKGRQIATNMGIMFNIDLPTNVSMWYPYRTDYRRKRSSDNDQILYNLMENVLSMWVEFIWFKWFIHRPNIKIIQRGVAKNNLTVQPTKKRHISKRITSYFSKT